MESTTVIHLRPWYLNIYLRLAITKPLRRETATTPIGENWISKAPPTAATVVGCHWLKTGIGKF